MIVESSFRGWEDARIVLSERGNFEWGILLFFTEIYDWKVENNQFVVNCSAVERINMIVGRAVALGVTRLAEHGVPLTEAFYPLTGKETYIRAECIDEHGHTAWTNPIWLSEFAKRRK